MRVSVALLFASALPACSLYFESARQGAPPDAPNVHADAAAAIPPFNVYLKASNTDAGDQFGGCVAMSADGSTLAVAAPHERSSAVGVGGSQTDNERSEAGAVYVFAREGDTWAQQAYLKGSGASGNFGNDVSISANGSTIVVGQPFAPVAGAAYVFERTAGTWQLVQELTAAVPEPYAFFGFAVAISGDAKTIAIGAYDEDSTDEPGSDQTFAGAVHVFTHGANGWTETADFAATDTKPYDYFGYDVALSHDGSSLVVGAMSANNGTGAAYVFTRGASSWQQHRLVAANASALDYFGVSVSISGDGATVAVGAPFEDGEAAATPEAGAAYIFAREGSTWSQTAYLGASNAGGGSGTGSGSGSGSVPGTPGDELGWSVALSPSGARLAVGAWREASNAIGIDGDGTDNSMPDAGAVYIFDRGVTWHQSAYIKASNTEAGDSFGASVSLSTAGALAIGARWEASNATGVGGDQSNNSASMAGAIYALTLAPNDAARELQRQ